MDEYIVQPGDTLYSIARMFQIPTDRLRAINPEVTGDTLLFGQALRVPPIGVVRPAIEVNAYTYPSYDPVQWSDIFRFLTYLSIFGNEILPGGMIASQSSYDLVQTARQYGVAPLMAITNTVEGVYSGELLHDFLLDTTAQQTLLENSIAIAQAYGYYGINFGFELIFPEDYLRYAVFLEQASNRLRELGLITVISIPLVMILENIDSLTEVLSLYDRVLERIIITLGDFTCSDTQTPIDLAQQGLDYVTQYISNTKILLGIPNCCYEWIAPFSSEYGYVALTADQADALVRLSGSNPEVDPDTQRVYFRIEVEGESPRMLFCDSVRNLTALQLLSIYNLGGISFRSLALFSYASYQAINVRNDILKVLP